jgi:hypothetical protein
MVVDYLPAKKRFLDSLISKFYYDKAECSLTMPKRSSELRRLPSPAREMAPLLY